MKNKGYNWNGDLLKTEILNVDLYNRGLHYGDGVFETLKFTQGRIHFWEDHYFRLMSSMRILRMEIPMSFSPEYLEEEIVRTLTHTGHHQGAARVKILVWRKAGGRYTPESNGIEFVITTESLSQPNYISGEQEMVVDLYKDFYKPKSLLSNLKSVSAQLFTLASIYREENHLDECLLLNEHKHLVEAISSNLFLVQNRTVITPALTSGCLKGVIRKQVLEILRTMDYEVREEESLSPFELQKATEVFLTNSIQGIRSVTRYRKKHYEVTLAPVLTEKLNIRAALA